MSSRNPQPLPFSDVEAAQLRRLVGEAFDLRQTAYLSDAVRAICDWHERTLPDRLEREARRKAA